MTGKTQSPTILGIDLGSRNVKLCLMKEGAVASTKTVESMNFYRTCGVRSDAGFTVDISGLGFPDVEKIIWEGKALNTTVVVVARADDRIPLNGEVLQVRRASVVGSQGHSGHGTFPNVINCMATGMDVSPLITKRIKLDEVNENLVTLQTDRNEVKITITDFE